jgi:hypothetical protein
MQPQANGSKCSVDECRKPVSNFSCELKVDINPKKSPGCLV